MPGPQVHPAGSAGLEQSPLAVTLMRPGHACAEHDPGSSHLWQASMPDDVQSGSTAPQPQSQRAPSL
jgi:hypothetical protein